MHAGGASGSEEGVDWLPILIGLAIALGILILMAGLMWGCRKVKGSKMKEPLAAAIPYSAFPAIAPMTALPALPGIPGLTMSTNSSGGSANKNLAMNMKDKLVVSAWYPQYMTNMPGQMNGS